VKCGGKLGSSHHPIIPSSHHPIIPSSHHPIIPSSHHPIILSSYHPNEAWPLASSNWSRPDYVHARACADGPLSPGIPHSSAVLAFDMRDTTQEAADIVRAAMLRRTPMERMREALELSETLRALAMANLRRQHPADSPIELVERLTGQSMRVSPRMEPRP
jgi:hypothetical protein